ncbi:Na+-dependent transporters of the SNF family [Dorea longicatena]|nr:Na+-dependent transporters of the SNF family [Dorea longicatena]
MKHKSHERDSFKSKTGFVLACIGSAVGMGNIWRFPYMVSDWGGMTFLIPYILFVILIGSSDAIFVYHVFRAWNLYFHIAGSRSRLSLYIYNRTKRSVRY